MIKAFLKTFGVFLLTGGIVGLVMPVAGGGTQAIIILGVTVAFFLLTYRRGFLEGETKTEQEKRWRRKYASNPAFGEIVHQIRVLQPRSILLSDKVNAAPACVILRDEMGAALWEAPWPGGARQARDVIIGMEHFGLWLNEQLQGAAVYRSMPCTVGGDVTTRSSFAVVENAHGEWHAYQDCDVSPERTTGYELIRR